MKLLYFNQLQPYTNHSWKTNSNNNITIIPKNIKNELPNNNKEYIIWNADCPIKKYKFQSNPIKHYRKQYSNVNSEMNTFSNLSLIGSLDKPGNNIVTQNINQCSDTNINIITYLHKNIDCNTVAGDKSFDAELNKVVCTSLHPSALVIKRATTNLSNNYSTTQREYLYNKCKTFNQNLPLNNEYSLANNVNGTYNINCNDKITCTTYNPSNNKFQTQGPITSSARTFSLKYGCKEGGSCNNSSNINNCPPNISLEECNNLKNMLNSTNPVCYGCVNAPTKNYRKRINILK